MMCLTERSTGEEAHGAAAISQPNGVIPPTKRLSRLTLSAHAGEPRSAPLREALRAVFEMFPGSSRVTIWPSAGGAACTTDYPASALTSAKVLAGVPLGGAATENTAAVDCGCSGGQSDEGGAVARNREIRRQWEPWCSSVSGARVVVGGGRPGRHHGEGPDGGGSTGEEDREQQTMEVVLEPGLLWRGPVVAAATIAPPTEDPPATASLGGSAPDQGSVFPALEGFALRVAAARRPKGGRALGDGGKEEEEVSDQLRTVPGSMATVSRAAAGILARASSLRLSRVISPSAVARVCHLLADGAAAPALELYAYDAERFPGGAAFLEGWAADGRGMLLVATAAAGTVAEGGGCGERDVAGETAAGAASAAQGEEGLAMACFPVGGRYRGRERGGSGGGGGGSSDAGATVAAAAGAVWSVTLFRRPSEFSEEAVAALVSGRGAFLEGAPPRCLKAAATVDDVSEGGQDGSSPAPRSLRRSSRISNTATTNISEDDKGGEQTPAEGGVQSVPAVAASASIADVIGGLPVFTWKSLLAETSVVVAGPVPSSSSKDGLSKNTLLGTAVSWKKGRGTPAALAAREGDVGLGRAVDGRLAGPSTCGSSTTLPSIRGTTAANKKLLVSPEVSGGTTNQTYGGIDRTTSAASSSASGHLADPTVAAAAAATYAVYGTFGNWRGDGPGGVRRFCWAEESLLPNVGNRKLLSDGSSGSRVGNAAAGGVPPSAASGGGGGGGGRDPRTAEAAGNNEAMLEERGRGDKTAMSSSSSSSSSSRGAGVTAAGAAAVAVPPRRTLSTAEEALEKAGHQQRARVKERRVIAREQSARMDRPRPRNWQGGRAGSSRAAAAVSASSGAGVSGSGVVRRPNGGAVGGGAFRRGSATAAVASSASGTGWSAAGSKLSRGSLILERSVGGAGAATGSRAVVGGGGGGGANANAAGAGSGAGVERAERGASGVGSGAPSAVGGPTRVSQPPPVNAGVLSRGVGAAAAAVAGGVEASTFNSRKEQQRPSATAAPSSSSSRSSLSAADAGRVRRAIFQDQPPLPPQPPQPATPVAPAAPEGVTAKRARSSSPLPLASPLPTAAVEGGYRREETTGDSTAAAGRAPGEAPVVGVTRTAAVTAEVKGASAAADGADAGESPEVFRGKTGQQQSMSAVVGGLQAGAGAGAGGGAGGEWA